MSRLRGIFDNFDRRNWVVNVAFIVGAGLIIVGTLDIHRGAGIIVGGALMLTAAIVGGLR